MALLAAPVLFADFAQLPESLPGIPSIVVDFVKYDSLEYLAGKGFGVRLDIVSYWSFEGEIQGSFILRSDHRSWPRALRDRRAHGAHNDDSPLLLLHGPLSR
jgi:hypothetical protein